MAQINILLKDIKSKTCQKMLFLREKTELLICENINTINKEEAHLIIQAIESNFSTTEMEKQGWKIDDGLYENLIIEFNNRPSNLNLLVRWK